VIWSGKVGQIVLNGKIKKGSRDHGIEWLCGYVVTWIRCYVVTWLRGYVVMWLRGYVVTWPVGASLCVCPMEVAGDG